jgi:hypothetical protein
LEEVAMQLERLFEGNEPHLDEALELLFATIPRGAELDLTAAGSDALVLCLSTSGEVIIAAQRAVGKLRHILARVAVLAGPGAKRSLYGISREADARMFVAGCQYVAATKNTSGEHWLHIERLS